MSHLYLVRDYIILGLYFIVAFLAIFGNLFVIHVIAKTPQLRTSNTYIILTNMAVSDILGGLAILLQFLFCSQQVVDLDADDLGIFLRICGFTKSLQILSYYISTYSMLFISIDRYNQLKYTSQNKYLKSAWAIAFSWLIGGLFVSTTFINMRVSIYFKSAVELISCKVAFRSNSSSDFDMRKFRIILLISTQYLFPLIMTGFFYFLIWRIIKPNSKVELTKFNQNQVMYQINSKKRTVIMLITIVVAFSISWAPLHFLHFYNFFVAPLTSSTCNSSTIYQLFYFLAISSCCFNPFFYYHSNSIFKDEITDLFNKIRCSKRKQNIESELNSTTMARWSTTSISNSEDS